MSKEMSSVRYRNRKSAVIRFLPVYGCIANGLIYTAVGVIALLSFFKIRNGGADEGSMLLLIKDYFIGKVFIGVVLTGALCFIIWRYYEAITDPYGYGSNTWGITKRAGIGLSTLADILIAWTATRVLFGKAHFTTNGDPKEEQEAVAEILQHSWGNELIIFLGVIIIVVGLMQSWYVVTRGYRERLDIDHFSNSLTVVTHVMAWSGYIARGVIVGVIGFFLLRSGITESAERVVNTDKAFDFIGDHVGHLYFILTALGTICYGAFMFILAFTYDRDKD